MRPLSIVIALLLALTACAAPAPNGGAQGNADSAALTADNAVQDPPTRASTPPAPPKKPMHTGGPLPAEPVQDDAPAIDTSCRTDADCTVKNVGNCCGYYPACVNVDSRTDPQGVQAACAKKGMASVCGFEEISACSCQQGRCQAASAAALQ